MNWMPWYDQLAKPSWTPAPATIGLIWQILYPIIAVSFGFVFIQALRGKLAWRVTLPLIVNLITNLAFIPILFGLRSLPLASVDVLLVWGTIVWTVLALWPRYRWVAWAQLPYFLWVSTAAVLQWSITWLNR
jgi:translocator protein